MQEILRENLIPGKEYYLQNFEEAHSPPKNPYKMIAKFEKLEQSYWNLDFKWACFSDFRKIEYRNDTNYNRCVVLNHNWRFYEIPSNTIQKNMENRAYNQVLLDLIGDEYFKPIEVI